MTKISISWREFAACKGRTEVFFSREGETTAMRKKREAEALLICSGCPVQEPCRNDGRVNNEIGVWGGETEEDRYKAGYIQTGAYVRKRGFRKKFGARVPESEIEKV